MSGLLYESLCYAGSATEPHHPAILYGMPRAAITNIRITLTQLCQREVLTADRLGLLTCMSSILGCQSDLSRHNLRVQHATSLGQYEPGRVRLGISYTCFRLSGERWTIIGKALTRRLEGCTTNLSGAEIQPRMPRRLTSASSCFGIAGAVLRFVLLRR